jgi:hypothetical protein
VKEGFYSQQTLIITSNFKRGAATIHSSIYKESFMRKSTIFISAVLTSFALVMLYNLASAYRNNQNASEVAAATLVQPTATLAPDPTTEPAPTQTFLSPQEAAQLATQVLGNTNLLSAESSSLNGVDAYKVLFTNNDVVYVGLDGQILSVQVAPMVVKVTLPQSQPTTKHNGSHSSNESHTSSAESQQEHED